MESGAAAVGRRVFISYARADQPQVETMVSALAGLGYVVWWDRHIAGGAAYAREIEAELRAAEAVVVAWSAASVDSDWVRDEAALARDLGRLIPVRLDKTPAPLGFGQYQVVDLSTWRGDAGAPEFGRLVQSVERVAGAEPPIRAAPSPPSPSPGRGPRLGRRALLLGGAVAAPAALAAWWLSRPGRLAPAPSARTIAVLPFANLSGDPAQNYFAYGLSDELINALARLGKLQVVARTSSFQFRADQADSHTIGQKLGVAYLLDGSVRREGQEVRVAAQLVDTATGFERWSQTYDRDMKDIFAVQSGIAEAVADALKVQLLGGDIAALSVGNAANAPAYDAYLQGKRLFDQGGVESTYRDALAKFDQAIAADPGYAAAYAARARVLVVLGDQFVGPDKLRATYAAAVAAAQKAVQLAPTLADAQETLAEALASGDLDFAGAR
ncbi:MAG: TIR domain-containing protein, partial [Caulobacteraceae bacterium]